MIAAAVPLFARHGVGGTSLQMIADEIGVTKAAVYHQYRTKDEIVLAAAETELASLEQVVEAAEAEPDRARSFDVLVDGMVDHAVQRGRTVSSILGDPVVVDFFAEHDGFRDVMRRMGAILVGDGSTRAGVRTAMLVAAVSGAVMHPLVADLDDATLRAELERLARGFLDLPR